jgi:hypothetical protein
MDEPMFYSNLAHVSFTPFDFRISFSLMRARVDSHGLVAEPPAEVAEVVLPAAAVEPLVDLLRAELRRFTEEFGAPVPSVMEAARPS